MGGVAVTIVDVIGMVAMVEGFVATAVAVGVGVGLVGHVVLEDALVPMPVVDAVNVAVVQVVGVVAVTDCDVPAIGAMCVLVVGVGVMVGGRHDWCSSIV
jgi:hypothetical protein